MRGRACCSLTTLTQAPNKDPAMTITHYDRTADQDITLGLRVNRAMFVMCVSLL